MDLFQGPNYSIVSMSCPRCEYYSETIKVKDAFIENLRRELRTYRELSDLRFTGWQVAVQRGIDAELNMEKLLGALETTIKAAKAGE